MANPELTRSTMAEPAAREQPGQQIETLFKAYDIRGRTDNGELTPEIMGCIGSAFAAHTEQKTIAVGHDSRLTSPLMAKSFAKGVLEAGKNVRDLGLVTTDTLYYATSGGEAAGAMITASHNPAQYNGVKLCKAGAMPMSTKELENLRDAIPVAPAAAEPGRLTSEDILPTYIEHLLEITDATKTVDGLRVAVDGSHGAAGSAIAQLFDRLSAEFVGIYLEPDGRFPNHSADPSRAENLADLVGLVREQSADLGVIFDGDADRAVFIDDKGLPLPGGTVVALMASWYLTNRRAGGIIVHDSICPRSTPAVIEACGGRAVRSRVGTPFIRQAMLEVNADFAGETSGHCYFKENFAIDSGLLSMLAMMRIVSEANQPLSALRRGFEEQAAYRAVTFKITDRGKALDKVEDAFRNRGQLDFFDGLAVSWPNQWFSLRLSNTEPIVRLHAEAADSSAVQGLIEEVADILGARPS